MSDEQALIWLPKRHATQINNKQVEFSEQSIKIFEIFVKTKNMQLIETLRLSFRKIKQIIPKRKKKNVSENELDADFVEWVDDELF